MGIFCKEIVTNDESEHSAIVIGIYFHPRSCEFKFSPHMLYSRKNNIVTSWEILHPSQKFSLLRVQFICSISQKNKRKEVHWQTMYVITQTFAGKRRPPPECVYHSAIGPRDEPSKCSNVRNEDRVSGDRFKGEHKHCRAEEGCRSQQGEPLSSDGEWVSVN